MAIVRWDPFDAFLVAQDDLNKLFRRSWLGEEPQGSSLGQVGTWAPAVDIYETGDSFVVEAELPGLDPADIEVSVDDGILNLKGERKIEKEVKEENYHRVERAYGMFQRAVRLPADVDPDAIRAGYDNGVLKVSVPKTEPKKPKSIPIDISGKKEKEKK